MGRYQKGDHVKIEVKEESAPIGEWMWVLVEDSDDDRQLIFGYLDNEPIDNPDMALGQKLAVNYANVREHRRFGEKTTLH